MLVSNRLKFVYFDIPKTGSRSTQDSLKRIDPNAKIIPAAIMTKGQFKKDTRRLLVHSRDLPEYAKNYTKIITVRNPYDWMVSSYYFYIFLDLKPKFNSIESFIDYCIWCVETHPSDEEDIAIYRHFPAYKYIEPFGYDIFLRLEKLSQEVHDKLSFVPENFTWQWQNKHPHPPASEVLDKNLKIKIQQWAGKDFELFGYTK